MNKIGLAEETLAAEYLQQKGLAIVSRNYQCRYGEIDIIASQGSTLIFVEVRSRTQSRFGGALSSITASKKAKLLATANHYLSRCAVTPACRFDVILFEGSSKIPHWLQGVIEEC